MFNILQEILDLSIDYYVQILSVDKFIVTYGFYPRVYYIMIFHSNFIYEFYLEKQIVGNYVRILLTTNFKYGFITYRFFRKPTDPNPYVIIYGSKSVGNLPKDFFSYIILIINFIKIIIINIIIIFNIITTTTTNIIIINYININIIKIIIIIINKNY